MLIITIDQVRKAVAEYDTVHGREIIRPKSYVLEVYNKINRHEFDDYLKQIMKIAKVWAHAKAANENKEVKPRVMPPSQEKILDFIEKNPRKTAFEIEQATGIRQDGVRQHLKRLAYKNMIKRFVEFDAVVYEVNV